MINRLKRRDFNTEVRNKLTKEFNLALHESAEVISMFEEVSNKTLQGSTLLAHKELVTLLDEFNELPSEKLLRDALKAMQPENPLVGNTTMSNYDKSRFLNMASLLYAYVKNERRGVTSYSKHLLTRFHPIELHTVVEQTKFLLTIGEISSSRSEDFIYQYNKLYDAVRKHASKFGLGTPLIHDEIKEEVIPLIQSNVKSGAPKTIDLVMNKVLADLKYALITDEETLDVEDDLGFIEVVAINSDVIKKHTVSYLLADLLGENNYGRGTTDMLEVLFQEVPEFDTDTIGYAIYVYLFELYGFLKKGRVKENNEMEVSSSILNAMLAVYLDGKSNQVIKEQVVPNLTTTDLHRYANVYEFYALMGYPRHNINKELIKLAKLLDGRRVPSSMIGIRKTYLTILDNLNKRKERPTPEFLKGSLLPMVAIHQMKVLRDSYEEYTR